METKQVVHQGAPAFAVYLGDANDLVGRLRSEAKTRDQCLQVKLIKGS